MEACDDDMPDPEEVDLTAEVEARDDMPDFEEVDSAAKVEARDDVPEVEEVESAADSGTALGGNDGCLGMKPGGGFDGCFGVKRGQRRYCGSATGRVGGGNKAIWTDPTLSRKRNLGLR